MVVEYFEQLGKVNLNEYEKQYIDILFASAAVQTVENANKVHMISEFEEKNKEICEEMLEYLSEILNINLLDNELLRTSLEGLYRHQLLEQLMERS